MPTRNGINANRSNLSRLLSEKHSKKRVEHCEQDLCGGGAQSASNINGRRPSDVVKKSDVVLFGQSSPPEGNAVQEVGFDDRRLYPAHDP